MSDDRELNAFDRHEGGEAGSEPLADGSKHALADPPVPARLQMVVNSMLDQAIVATDLEGRVTLWSAGARAITGYSEFEMLGRHVADALRPDEDLPDADPLSELCQMIGHGISPRECWQVRRDGSRFWASGSVAPLLDGTGQIRGFLINFCDRTKAHADQVRREFLVEEMNHRLKNSYAFVQSIASQTARHAPTPAEFLSGFSGRLVALARSNDQLVRAGSEDILLSRVAEDTLAAHLGEGGRIAIEGPPVLLRAEHVALVSLALHELATNAIKYGALSASEGRVVVAWTEDRPRHEPRLIRLTWREQGGPPVRPPVHRGFGSRLLERGMPRGVIVTLNYRPRGVECEMTLPLDKPLET